MKIYTHSNSAIRGRQRQFKFTSPELIKSGRGKSSPIPREGGQPFDRRLTTIYRITSPSDLCDPVASRVARHFSASRRDTISPTRHTRHNSPPPPPPCRISLRGPSAVCRNDQAVKARLVSGCRIKPSNGER